MNKNILIILISCVLLISGCFKDKDLFETYPDIPSSWANLQKAKLDVSGEILDERGFPIANVKVIVGNEETTTDKRGFFILQKVNDTPDRVYIKVEKDGFFKGSRVIHASIKTMNYVKIVLLEKKRVASFDAKLGSSVNVGKAKIQFPKNGFKDAFGKPYTGMVTVEAKYLDPSKNETMLQMPGNLQGINFKGEEQILGTYGMVVCELKDASGNLINLNGDSTATITYPITSKFQEVKPVDVPLWYFDENVGAWREEGTSTLVGNNYVGKVKHFSFWNCDYPFPSVNFETAIKDENNNPLKGLVVMLCFKTGKDSLGVATGSGWTDENGWVGGRVPKNQVFTLKIADPNCYKILYTQQIGPFDKDVILPSIALNLPSLQTIVVKIKGKLTDCSGNPVKKGYAYFTGYLKNGTIFSNYFAAADSTGNYSATLLNSNCYSASEIDKVTVQGIDYNSNKESLIQSYPIVKGDNDLGTINLCNNYSEFINLNIDGKDYVFPKPSSQYGKDVLVINASGDSTTTQQNFFYMQINLGAKQTPGKYEGYIGTSIIDGKPLYFANSSIPVEITTFASTVGEYFEGTINNDLPPIILKDPQGVSYTIKGNFKIKRLN